MQPFKPTNKLGIKILSFIQGYDHEKYWRRRSIVINPDNKTNILLKLYYLYYIKRTDARHLCSFGTNINAGARFDTPPFLPHGPNGIIVGQDVKVGKGCIIYHQVTIAAGNTEVGDGVELGAGAKVLPNVKIGNNARVGTNCVVVQDVPENATVVLHKPRVIIRENSTNIPDYGK